MITEMIADINVVKITMDNQIYIKKNWFQIDKKYDEQKKVLESEYPTYLCDKRPPFVTEVHYFQNRKSSHSYKQEEIAIRCARENSCRPPRPSRLIILIWLRFISAWWFVCSRSFVSIYGISPSNRPIRSVYPLN